MRRMWMRSKPDCVRAVAEREAILLVRLDGVGDAALCIPALEGLRRAFPGARFGAVCSPRNEQLYSGLVETVHVWRDGSQPRELGEELAAQRYTRALIATEEVAGYALGRLSGASRRAGFWHSWQKPFKSLWQRAQLTDPVFRSAAWVKRPEHEVETLYRLAQALGAQSPPPSEPADLRAWLRAEDSPRIAPAHGAIAFQITPKLVVGGWGPRALAHVVSTALRDSDRARGVLLASAHDERLARAVLESMPPTSDLTVQLLAPLPPPLWLGALSRAAALVTPDTGAAHVAGMLGAGVVDIFDESDHERLARQWRPWAGRSRCLVKGRWREGAERPLGARIGTALQEVVG